jgi:hypothetical protein
MPIDETSPYWSLLSEQIRVLLTLPDPPPDELRQVYEVAALTAISALSQHISQDAGNQVRSAVNTALQKARGAQAGK